jgi:hypothetical protein
MCVCEIGAVTIAPRHTPTRTAGVLQRHATLVQEYLALTVVAMAALMDFFFKAFTL